MDHKKIGTSLLRTSLVVVSINVLSKVLGVAREALIAGSFGARETTDAFFTAWRLPDVLFNSLLGVLIANTFIPVYYELSQKHGDEAARRFARAAMGAVLAALAVLAAAYALFAPTIMTFLAPGLAPEAHQLATRMARMLAPVVLAGGFTGLFRSLLHANRQFIAPAFLPVVQNVCVILMLLTLAGTYGVQVLAQALLLSSALQALMLLVPLGRSGEVPVPALDFSDPGIKRMGVLMLPAAVTFALGNVVPLVEVHLASQVSTGAISYLSYAYRLFSLPEQIFVLALSAMLFPFLARDASLGDSGAMTEKFSAGLRLSLYLMLPLGMFLAVYSHEFVRIFLGWGSFDEAAVAGTGLTLAAYSGGLFAVCARNLLVDACFAIKAPGLILRAAAAMIPVNVALDIWLSRTLGAPGLSLGFSVTAVLHCAVLYLVLRAKLGGLDQRALAAAFGRALLAGLAMTAVAWQLKPSIQGLMHGHGFAARLATLALAGAASLIVYAGVQALLRCPEQRLITAALRRRNEP
jgi:putative peptidoglycan lipid II flippase